MSKRVPLVASAVLMATVGFSQTPQSRVPLTVPELVKRSSSAVVQIVASGETGGQMLGSGFVVSEDGKIVTNFHVIEGANSATVKLANGSSLPVKGILAQDANKDLVILKVDGGNLKWLEIDSMFKLQVGDHVVAIGSPLGFEGTVSDGIVSAIRTDEEEKTWIQTTAPVSHGNSGGPLLNMHGRVVGVIARGMNPNEGQNLNFAIPAFKVAKLLSRDLSISPLGNECTTIASQ
jgi:serine protease Do